MRSAKAGVSDFMRDFPLVAAAISVFFCLFIPEAIISVKMIFGFSTLVLVKTFIAYCSFRLHYARGDITVRNLVLSLEDR